MKVTSYCKSDKKEHWIDEMSKCDWDAGQLLYRLLSSGEFHDFLGKKTDVLLLTEGDELISFCTYAEMDDIQPTDLTPWMGFVFTFAEHRGHHYVGLLFEEVERLAKADGFSQFYISTNHVGLYEKYGCEYLTEKIDMSGEPSRIYIKKI